MGIFQRLPGLPPFRTWLWAAPLLLLGLSAFAGDTRLLLGPGLANLRRPPREAYLSFELIHAFDRRPWGIFATAEAASDEEYYGVGLYLEWRFAERWTAGISSGPGWYSDHWPVNLGSRLEFRSTAYLSYELPRRTRIGVSLSHYSNAGIATHNPGAESLRVFVAIPLGRHGEG